MPVLTGASMNKILCIAALIMLQVNVAFAGFYDDLDAEYKPHNRFDAAAQRAAEQTSRDLADEMPVTWGELQALREGDRTLRGMEEMRKAARADMVRRQKTTSLIAFGIAAGICIWGLHQGNVYGIGTAILFGYSAGRNLGDAVYSMEEEE